MSDYDRSADALERSDLAGTSFLNEATLRALIEQIPLTIYIDRLDDVSSNVYTSPQQVGARIHDGGMGLRRKPDAEGHPPG